MRVSTHVDWADNGLSPYPVHEQLEQERKEELAHFSAVSGHLDKVL